MYFRDKSCKVEEEREMGSEKWENLERWPDVVTRLRRMSGRKSISEFESRGPVMRMDKDIVAVGNRKPLKGGGRSLLP